MNYFPLVDDRKDVADLLRIPLKALTYILYVKGTDNCYKTFEIPKKAGGTRAICAPSEELKTIQKRLADCLWDYQKDIWGKEGIHPNLSHGFIKGKSIFSNASIHKNKRYVLNLDLVDFFNTIHFGRVCGYFKKNRYFRLAHEAAVTLAQLTCYKGSLPQGAPSSPIITNLICQVLDFHLLKIAKDFHADYTRYADDLTFSTNDHTFLNNYERFLSRITLEIERNGFSVNTQKTRLQFRNSKQIVTGLVVNKKINIDRNYYRLTRAMANQLYKKGEFSIAGTTASLNQLEGRFAFIDQISHFNNKRDCQKHDANCLSGKERDYQAFLFYKYFFANDLPIIITEGKTDIVYIKAALMNLYKDYPNLIQKDPSGGFRFKVSFLKRTKRWRYFFMISPDGADTFSYLYNCFRDTKGNPPNYIKSFKKLSGKAPQNPVFLVFDNETISNRPLKKFLQSNGVSRVAKEALQNELCCRPLDDANLYLLTIPLIGGKSECEIEDLFSEDVLNQVIDGRSFDRRVEKGDRMHYGKEVFSKYVYSHYKVIDFSRFKPLLDSLSLIISSN